MCLVFLLFPGTRVIILTVVCSEHTHTHTHTHIHTHTYIYSTLLPFTLLAILWLLLFFHLSKHKSRSNTQHTQVHIHRHLQLEICSIPCMHFISLRLSSNFSLSFSRSSYLAFFFRSLCLWSLFWLTVNCELHKTSSAAFCFRISSSFALFFASSSSSSSSLCFSFFTHSSLSFPPSLSLSLSPSLYSDEWQRVPCNK